MSTHLQVVTVHFERREDDGLRAWCDTLPGFALSHADREAVMADVRPALEGILSAQVGRPITARLLHDERNGVVPLQTYTLE